MLRRKTADMLLIFFSLTLLILPFLGMLFPIEPDVSLLENRALAAFPKIGPDMKDLETFPQAFKRYFSDHYGFRKSLTYMDILVSLKWLNRSVIKDIMIGKDGWLFWGGDDVIQHMKARSPLPQETLEKLAKIHEDRYRYCAERGIRYLFIVPPNKSTIYPEYLPDGFYDPKPESHCRQLVSYLRKHTHIDLLYLAPDLLSAKTGARLYFKADTHWNYMGGFIGYRKIIEKLTRWYPNMKPMDLSDFTFKTELKTDAELARMIGLREYLDEPYKTFVPKSGYRWKWVDPDPFYKEHGHEFPRLLVFENKEKDPSLPKAVMYNDSLTWFMGYFLSNHFRRITYVYQTLGYDNFDTDIIDYEKPDIVLAEIGERFFLNLPESSSTENRPEEMHIQEIKD